MKYKIVTAPSSEAMEKKVQELMDKHGCEPLGAHTVVTWKNGFWGPRQFEYSQVLINQGE